MNSNENYKKYLARKAVDLGLLVFSPAGRPFPARRGGSPSEVIIDVRGAAGNLTLRSLLLGSLLCELSKFPAEAVIGGVSRGGIVFGAQLALVAGRPFVTVLPEGVRSSGLRRSVEGNVQELTVVLFDNVATTGQSLRDAGREVAHAGGTVAGALVISSYDEIPSLSFPFHQLFEFRDLVNAEHEAGKIDTSRRNNLLKNE
jgi:orotate phosphoribosyltransferase